MTDMVQTILTFASPILVAMITGAYALKQTKVQKKIERRQDEAEERNERRAKESLLNMKMADANTQLTIGVAMALKNGRPNGEIEEGLKAVNEARTDYNNFLKELAIHEISI